MLNGRYGADKPGYLMIFTSIVLTLTAALLNPRNFVMKIILLIIAAVILSIAIYRIFSKHIDARQREKRAYDKAVDKLHILIGKDKAKTDDELNNESNSADSETKTQSNTEDTSTTHEEIEFKHFRCPKCKKHLKVPSGKGYIKVSCPSCGYKFTRHT